MDGFQFLERFRKVPENCNVPVIIWTASDLSAAEEAHLRGRAHAIHSKVKGGMTDLLHELQRALPQPVTPTAET
jgi:CheY-like chemotaxis protein